MKVSDAGGVAAKYGFFYQDCVAAYFVTTMLLDKTIRAIRCEVTDDIDIVYPRHEEYVQVKTTDSSKWSVPAITKNSKYNLKTTLESSIVHKSMQCMPEGSNGSLFRIVSPEATKEPLTYLEMERKSRSDDVRRDVLIKALDLKLDSYETPAGIGVAAWVDATWWQVIASIREVELMGLKNIRTAAFEVYGVQLATDSMAEGIWRDIIYTVTRQSTLSRHVYTEDDKTYFRSNFLDWFNAELNFHKAEFGQKIYVGRTLPRILQPVNTAPLITPCGMRNGVLLQQRYQLNAYRYDFIASSICHWLDEIFLRPREIADIDGLSFYEKTILLRKRVLASASNMDELIGRVLLHSTIRKSHDSQPIPATLYLDRGNDAKVLENVHIVRQPENQDQLWIGFSGITTAPTVHDALTTLRELLYEDIKENFDGVRNAILDIKEDAFLLHHDIDSLLDISVSLDEYLDRFNFVLFFGYNSEWLTDPMTAGYETRLIREANELFNRFIDDLTTSTPFSCCKVSLYIYPAPNLETLKNLVESKIMEEI